MPLQTLFTRISISNLLLSPYHILIICLVALSACSSKQIVVDLNSSAPHEMTSSNTTTFKYKNTFYLDQLIDQRSDNVGTTIGFTQTGILNKPTPLLVSESFEITARKALSQRMKNRGFQLSENSTSSEYIMQATVKRLQYSEKTTLTSEHGICDAEITFLVSDRKKIRSLTLDTSARAEIPSGMDVTGNASVVLATCLDMTVIKMINTNIWSQLIR